MIEEIDVPAPSGLHPTALLDAGALIAIPPSATCAACVVIPARDEAASIERTLLALAAQHTLDGQPLDPASFEVILLANNCRDETASLARQLAGRNPRLTLHVVELDLPAAQAHVGYARRLAMDEACRRLMQIGRPRGVIATTDADTMVTPTWLAATLHEVALGAEAVGGRIRVAAAERQLMAPSVRSRFLRNVGYWALVDEVGARIDPRPGDPWPRHGQFSGASMAVTAQAYRAVGGLPPLPSSEDVALADALRRQDIEIRHSPAVHVLTSARMDGRAPDGMAALLTSWSDPELDGQLQLVPSAERVVIRATMRRALRDLWRQAHTSRELCSGEVVHLAEFARVSDVWLAHALLDADRFGALLDDFEEQAQRHREPDPVDVRDAIAELRQWLEPYRRPGALQPAFARHVAGLPFLPPMQRPLCLAAPTPLASPARHGPRSAPLEQIQPVGEIAAPLAPPPQVA